MWKRLNKDEVASRLKEANWDFAAFPLYMTLEPHEADIDLLIKWRDAVAAYREEWRAIYAFDENDEDKEYSWEETDFRGFTEGYLIAKGVSHRDAKFLDTFLRYNLQYFDVDPAICSKDQSKT